MNEAVQSYPPRASEAAVGAAEDAGTLNPLRLLGTAARLFGHAPTITRAGTRLAGELADVVVGRSEIEAERRDWRFQDPTWIGNPAYHRLMQGYLAASSALAGVAEEAEVALELPAALRGQFLDMFASNLLTQPGGMTVLGSPVDLGRVKVDAYITGGTTDHLTPWRGCYASSQLLGGHTTFVLANTGHIQTLICPPGNPRSRYWIGGEPGADADAWKATAEERTGVGGNTGRTGSSPGRVIRSPLRSNRVAPLIRRWVTRLVTTCWCRRSGSDSSDTRPIHNPYAVFRRYRQAEISAISSGGVHDRGHCVGGIVAYSRVGYRRATVRPRSRGRPQLAHSLDHRASRFLSPPSTLPTGGVQTVGLVREAPQFQTP